MWPRPCAFRGTPASGAGVPRSGQYRHIPEAPGNADGAATGGHRPHRRRGAGQQQPGAATSHRGGADATGFRRWSGTLRSQGPPASVSAGRRLFMFQQEWLPAYTQGLVSFPNEQTLVLGWQVAKNLSDMPTQKRPGDEKLPGAITSMLAGRGKPTGPVWVAGHSDNWPGALALPLALRLLKLDEQERHCPGQGADVLGLAGDARPGDAPRRDSLCGCGGCGIAGAVPARSTPGREGTGCRAERRAARPSVSSAEMSIVARPRFQSSRDTVVAARRRIRRRRCDSHGGFGDRPATFLRPAPRTGRAATARRPAAGPSRVCPRRWASGTARCPRGTAGGTARGPVRPATRCRRCPV